MEYKLDDYEVILRNYRELFKGDEKFFADAIGCNKCAKSDENPKGLYNLLVSDPFAVTDPEASYKWIQATFTSLNVDIAENLENVLKHGADDGILAEKVCNALQRDTKSQGLSAGLNPWMDWIMLQWGPEYNKAKNPCSLMVIGADWHPLASSIISPLEAQHPLPESYLGAFLGVTPNWEKALQDCVKQYHIAFTNAVFSNRSGVQSRGRDNLPDRFLREYRPLLQRQIEVVQPKAIATWGTQVAFESIGPISEIADHTFNNLEALMNFTLENPSYIVVNGRRVRWFPLYHPSPSARGEWSLEANQEQLKKIQQFLEDRQ